MFLALFDLRLHKIDHIEVYMLTTTQSQSANILSSLDFASSTHYNTQNLYLIKYTHTNCTGALKQSNNTL